MRFHRAGTDKTWDSSIGVTSPVTSVSPCVNFAHRDSSAPKALATVTALFFALTTLLLPTPAHAEWREATSEHFVVVSGGSERELVRLSQRLEAVHWMMTLVTGVTPNETTQRVRIYLVDNMAQVHRAIGANPNSQIAGFYRPDLTGAVAVTPRGEGDFSTTILFHEYAHHFMLQYLPAAYPPWFVEGFAEFISTASFERAGAITIGKAANHRAYELDQVRWVPVPRMFQPRTADDREAGVASYGQYWAAAHYLLLDNDRRRQLNQFVNAINRGVSEAEAYGVFAGGLDQLDRDMRGYARRTSFEGRVAQLPPGVLAMPTVRVMRPGETALIEHELQAGRNLDEAERTALISRIAAVAARYPDDPAVALLHARVLFDAENWAEAQGAADRVLALDPDSVRAKAYKGWAMLKAHEEAAGSDTTIVEQARALIVAANRAAPNDPVPLVAYFQSFNLADQPTPAVALDGLVQASTLVPQEDGLRMTAAMALLSRRVLPRARRLLLPLAYAPHRSAQQGYALQLVQWIDNGGEGQVPTYLPVPDVEVAED